MEKLQGHCGVTVHTQVSILQILFCDSQRQNEIADDEAASCPSPITNTQKHSLQNRHNFLRISGEQRGKQGEQKAQVVCDERSASDPPFARNFALASLSPLSP